MPYYAATASYLVNRHLVRLLHDVIGEKLADGAHLPIDLFIRDEAMHGRFRVRSLFPFITSVLPGRFASTIDHEDGKTRWTLVMDLPRHSFFVDCDPRATLDLAWRLLPTRNAGPRERLHTLIAGYLASDTYQ